jgi:hypothetical protein
MEVLPTYIQLIISAFRTQEAKRIKEKNLDIQKSKRGEGGLVSNSSSLYGIYVCITHSFFNYSFLKLGWCNTQNIFLKGEQVALLLSRMLLSDTV